ncbi:glycosyltransferase family 2 protein [Polynucleobacter sp.]|uniref:glycosyltransferase family 2 protein n=1 Tax=Polynucleobacter sp. TaxID=2029855 RepID=UPI003F6977DB
MHYVKVSVILPAYNAENYISESILSILNQTYPYFELIIIDDGSCDQTFNIIKSFNDSRIRVIQNQINQGLIECLNLGAGVATGVYLARMDADDIAESNRLLEQVIFLEHNAEVVVLGSGIKIIDGDGEEGIKYLYPESHSVIEWALHFYCPLAHPTVMIRLSAVDKRALYNHDAKYAEDYDLWQRLIKKYRFANLRSSLLRLRKHDSNISLIENSAHQKNALLVAKRQIETTLLSPISMPVTQCLLSLGKECSSVSFDAINVIQKIRINFLLKNKNISQNDLKKINSDAAFRIFIIGCRNISIQMLFNWLLIIMKLDPFIFFKSLVRYFKKKISRGVINLA